MESYRIEEKELVFPAMYGLQTEKFRSFPESQNWLLLGAIPYEKGSGMNRLSILGSNGVISLTIPIKKNQKGAALSEIKIDNQQRWQHQHWQSIQSCYGKSPYFQYFKTDLEQIYIMKKDFLLEFNIAFLSWIHRQFFPKGKFKVNMAQPMDKNFDHLMLHKAENQDKEVKVVRPKYAQVFGQEFVPSLSVLDALFCAGPDYARW